MICADCSTSLEIAPCARCAIQSVPVEAGRAAVCSTCWYGLPLSAEQAARFRRRDSLCHACARWDLTAPALDCEGAVHWSMRVGLTWAPQHNLEHEAPPAPRAQPQALGGAGKRLLIVDDDEDILASATDILENHGYVVSLALDGKQAMSWLQSPGDLPDAILMDLHMPGMDGEKFSDARRSISHAAKIPLIIWSAHTLTDEKVQAMAAHGFVKKPCEANTLVAAIDNAIGT